MSVTRADGTITVSGYAVSNATKYHVTYSSDGKQSWTSASDSHAGSSITITGADNAKTYYIAVRAGNDGGWSGWTNTPAVRPRPEAPSGLTVTPSGDNLNVSWNAVDHAVGYDVRSSTDGSSWTTEHSNLSATSASVANADDAIEYIAVRARNAGGPGPWAEISRLPAHGWLTTMQQSGGASAGPEMAAAQSGASAQSANAQSQLTAPTWGTITRDNGTRANGYDQSLTVNWTAVTGATGYYVVCSATGGWNWWDCGTITSGSTTTLTVDNDANGNDLGRSAPTWLACAP